MDVWKTTDLRVSYIKNSLADWLEQGLLGWHQAARILALNFSFQLFLSKKLSLKINLPCILTKMEIPKYKLEGMTSINTPNLQIRA
jgi:hypothetical protein